MRARVGALIAMVVLAGCAGPTDPGPSTVVLEAVRFVTEAGELTVVLYPDAAPETVALMKQYVAEGYYVGREFNRVVPTHVIQVVDKAGGATDDPRRVPLETHPAYHFSAGAAGIARGAELDSGGPEVFFMDFATSHLDGDYTVWGQIVTGLDVVHRIARVQAVELREVPVVGDLTTDRMAVDAVAITAAELVHVRLDREDAAAFPYQVARNQRAGDYRHSLEWPADLTAERRAELTWYVRPYNGTRPPAPSTLSVRLGTGTVSVAEDPDAVGAYHFAWTPPAPGRYNATLIAGERELATLHVDVPS